MYLLFNTIRHMKFKQILYRILYEFTKRYRKKIKQYKGNSFNSNFYYLLIDNKKTSKYYKAKYKCDLEIVNGLLSNNFNFLNGLSYKFEHAINWKANPFKYRLWNFNLNYFDYLEELIKAYILLDDYMYIQKGYEFIDSWIEQNLENYEANIWDSYVVAKRIINWIKYFSFISDTFSEKIKPKYISALETQLQYLSRNIEYYLQANHVIMDAKGLIFGGVYLNNAQCLNKGINILKKEYEKQVMHDGGHYERSTSYHIEVLKHYFECSVLFYRNGYIDESKDFIKLIEPMFVYLYNITMPNKEISLLNDSSLEYPLSSSDLLQCGAILLGKGEFKNKCKERFSEYSFKIFGLKGVEKFNSLPYEKQSIKNIDNKHTGYYIIKDLIVDKELYLLYDCGNNGPDYNLGHTHADNLNIVFTIGNNKIFVDSGTYTYKKGEQRNYFRSTNAHNTIAIDGISSSEVWGAFRVGKRAKTRLLNYEETKVYTYISSEQDGYTKVLNKDKIFHRRDIVYVKQKTIIIVDFLYGNIKNKHLGEINYFLGNVGIKKKNDTLIEIILDNNKTLKVKANYKMKIIDSEISEYFNKRERSYKIVGNCAFNKKIILISEILLKDSQIKVKRVNNTVEIKDNNEVLKSIFC